MKAWILFTCLWILIMMACVEIKNKETRAEVKEALDPARAPHIVFASLYDLAWRTACSRHILFISQIVIVLRTKKGYIYEHDRYRTLEIPRYPLRPCSA